jgi:hypothetical protein
MKIAVLINHNTAAKFYSELFKKLGHQVYIPLYCSLENYTLQYDNVKKYRNINEDEFNFVKTLDEFDFYNNNNESDNEKIFLLLNNNFDIIITLHCINNILNIKLSTSNKKVYFILWGDFDRPNPYLNCHNSITNIENKYYLFCHKFLLNNLDILYSIKPNKIKFMRLGINDICSYENTYINDINNTNNNLLIIISRLHLFPNIIEFIINISLKLPNININIVGKNNNIKFNNKNIILHESFTNETDLYEFIKKFKLSLNINHHVNIIQYSAVELSCIGFPIIYSKNSSMSKIINNPNIFEYSNLDELYEKILFFINTNNLLKYEEVYKNNNKIIYENYKISNVIEDYKEI